MFFFLKDLFRLETPGGGGFGLKEEVEEFNNKILDLNNLAFKTGSLSQYSFIQQSA